MKVWICESFAGHYLTGNAVVVAETHTEARRVLRRELRKRHLKLDRKDKLEPLELGSGPTARILFDGDY